MPYDTDTGTNWLRTGWGLMSQPFTIRGAIHRADDGRPEGVRVVAHDRDLPSVERLRGGEPELLGVGVGDTDGRFSIEFDNDRYSTGEGSSVDPSKGGPDIGFRAFAHDGRELLVRGVEGDGRDRDDASVIHNAVSPLEVVLYLDAAPGDDDVTSEYEILISRTAPVAAGVSLHDLRDDDLVFLRQEFGWAEDSPEVPRLALLRAASALGADTGIEVAAYYGWARIDVPDGWADLPSLDDAAERAEFLRRILERLAASEAPGLVEALRRAAHDRIIPAQFELRADAIVHQIGRRDLQAVNVRLQLVSESDGTALPGYTVTADDVDEVTDFGGYFDVTYHAHPDRAADEHALELSIAGPLLLDPLDLAVTVTPGPLPTTLTVHIPSAIPALGDLRDRLGVELTDHTLETLTAAGISTFADIRRTGGLAGTPIADELDEADMHTLEALTEMDRICTDPAELTHLARHYSTVIGIADTPQDTFVATVSEGDHVDRSRAVELHSAARAQTDILDILLTGIAASVFDGLAP